MTAQIAETLIYEGREVSMCTEPLADFFLLAGAEPEFDFTCTALWRGYVGTWEIVGDRLYLIALSGRLKDGGEATLETVFPGYPERVFAHWYSGTLRIPEGKQLEYVHMGYASRHERDRFLTIEKGIMVDCRVRQNGIAAEATGPDGYAVGAMTIVAGRGHRGADE